MQGLSQDAMAESDPTEEVPRVVGYRHTDPEEIKMGQPPERESVYGHMPRADWVQLQAVYKAANQLWTTLPVGINVGL